MKLTLGTAQFGLDYGISNNIGRVDQKDVEKILKVAKNAGISSLDTASDYGSSEKVLGISNIREFEIISKFGAIPDPKTDIKQWLYDKVKGSLELLNIDKLHAYLLHKPTDLLSQNGENIYKTLCDLKAQGFIDNIGISIYDPSELELLIRNFDFDIVQAPMNVFDRRLYTSGWLNYLKEQEIEVHVRSVFLQGLLLMDAKQRPESFNKWSHLFKNFDIWLMEESISALEACLGFVKEFEHVDKIIVGVNSLPQLINIIKVMENNKKINAPYNLYSEVDELINPVKWS